MTILTRFYSDIDSLQTFDPEINFYLNKHKRFRVIVAGLIGRESYKALTLNYNEDDRISSELFCMYSCIFQDNLDCIIDEGEFSQRKLVPEEKVELLNEFGKIFNHNKSLDFSQFNMIDEPKLKELEILANRVRSFYLNSPNSNFLDISFQELNKVTIEQAKGEFKKDENLTDLVNLHPTKKIIKNLEDEISNLDLNQEVENRLCSAIRLGIYSVGCITSYPLILQNNVDIDSLKALSFFSTNFMIRDDIYDIKRDLKSGQKTFATIASRNELNKIKEFGYDLSQKSYELIPKERRKHLRNLDLCAKIFTYRHALGF